MGASTVVSTRPRWRLLMVCYHWGSRSPETAYVRAPASWPGGRRLSGSGSTIGARSSGRCRDSRVTTVESPPPQSPQRMIIKTWQFEVCTTNRCICSISPKQYVKNQHFSERPLYSCPPHMLQSKPPLEIGTPFKGLAYLYANFS